MSFIYLEIEKQANDYHGWVHRGDRRSGKCLASPLALAPAHSVTISKQTYTLKDLMVALIHFDAQDLALVFSEQGQLALGSHLYQQTLKDYVVHGPGPTLIVVTDDPWIASLPWPLIACRGIFLAQTGWQFALSRSRQRGTLELPIEPRLLCIMPQPNQVGQTESGEHLAELKQLLAQLAPVSVSPSHFRSVQKWSDVQPIMAEFRPHLVYYYGHGALSQQALRLVFENDQKAREDVSILDLAECLRAHPPLLVYLNCCLGDAAGLLGAGRQLGDFVPVVITNRTVATINAARAQGRALLERILLHGDAPHTAVASGYNRLGAMGLSHARPEWFTPIIHIGYHQWRAKPYAGKVHGGRVYDPHWHLKLDRRAQFSLVTMMVQEMIKFGKPKALLYLWCGAQGQGVDIFHERLDVQLREFLPNVHLQTVKLEWPMLQSDATANLFAEMLTHAFQVERLEAIPARMREFGPGQVVVYLNHSPVQSKYILDIPQLEAYVAWLAQSLIPYLEPQQFLMVGISFEKKDPGKYLERLHEVSSPSRMLVVDVLEELKPVFKRDLITFLDTHNIFVDPKRLDQVLAMILKKTGGHYEATLNELEQIIRKGAPLLLGETSEVEDDGED